MLTILLTATTAAVVGIPCFLRLKRLRPGLSDTMEAWGWAEADSLPTDSLRIVAALENVIDPEIGYSVVELGLLHEVRLDSLADIRVVMALTTPECPYGYVLGEAAVKVLRDVPGVGQIRVRFDPRIRWNPELMTGRARARYERVFGLGRTRR